MNLWNYAAVSSNRKQAIDDMRGTVAFYSSIAQYHKYYAAHGFGSEANAVVEAAQRNDTAAMLKAVYPAIKAAHPDVAVLSAPMAMTLEGPERRGNMNEIDYWNKLYDAGAKGNFDIVSANGYGLDQPPETPPDPTRLRGLTGNGPCHKPDERAVL